MSVDSELAVRPRVFKFEENEVRVVVRDGEPWWVLSDVCKVLGVGNTSDVARRLKASQKGIDLIDTLGGRQEMTVITESGLYAVIFRSDKPEAERFQDWVFGEVLPQIRKTGSYGHPALPKTYSEALRELAAQVERNEAQNTLIASKDARIEDLRERIHQGAEKVMALKPKVVFANSFGVVPGAVMDIQHLHGWLNASNDSYNHIGEINLNKWLRSKGLVERRGSIPTQSAINAKWLFIEHGTLDISDGRGGFRTIVTRKGVITALGLKSILELALKDGIKKPDLWTTREFEKLDAILSADNVEASAEDED